MSSVLSEYPETLPAPMVGVVTPTERRKVGSIGGVQSFRTVQRDRHGTRTYAFTFTKEQAAIFREWWVEWEQRGGGWFAANWPLPWSRGPNVFRFKNPPEWSLIGGGVDGQGYWRVSGSVEIRGRGMLPTVEVMYLTSTPYPIAFIEGVGVAGGSVKPIPNFGLSEGVGLDTKVISATAWDGFAKTTIPPDGITTSAVVTSASAVGTVYRSLTLIPEGLQISSAVVSANSYIGRVVYSNYMPEGISLSTSVVSATATGG